MSSFLLPESVYFLVFPAVSLGPTVAQEPFTGLGLGFLPFDGFFFFLAASVRLSRTRTSTSTRDQRILGKLGTEEVFVLATGRE